MQISQQDEVTINTLYLNLNLPLLLLGIWQPNSIPVREANSILVQLE